MSNGRSIDQFVRLLDALQTSDANGVAPPENWHPGDRVILPPAKTADEAFARLNDAQYPCKDFYYCTKAL